MFEIFNNKVIPWVIIPDGNGHMEKGFKTEWATVKDEILYLGSMGKEWTTASGSFESYDPMWVKAVSKHGEVNVCVPVLHLTPTKHLLNAYA